MTGEMGWVKPNGSDSNGDSWPVHAAIARAVGGKLQPFDVYAGPYIQTAAGRLWVSSEDGFLGTVCLWPGGIAPAWREPIARDYGPYSNTRRAIAAARAILSEVAQGAEMTAYTPGPWYCIIRPERDIYEIFADGRDIPIDERAANCRLIEAAPAMAEALRALLDAHDYAENVDPAEGTACLREWQAEARSILATIEGK